MSAPIRRRVVVHGLVQGVFFRDSTRGQAIALGLGGWVRNCSDGTVEAVFEGAPDAVAAAIEWCRNGPPRARVIALDQHDDGPPRGITGFTIR